MKPPRWPRTPEAVRWWGTWTLTLMVLALIAIAVRDELAIAHPGDDATLGSTLLTFGGPALFLLAQMFFLHEALGRAPRSRPLGVAGLALAILARGSSAGIEATSLWEVYAGLRG